jgi:hypothetical protein
MTLKTFFFASSVTQTQSPTALFAYIQGKYEEQFERSDEFEKQLIIKVREILTDKEWRRRRMQMRVSLVFRNLESYHLKN